jgi:hypothetical protein
MSKATAEFGGVVDGPLRSPSSRSVGPGADASARLAKRAGHAADGWRPELREEAAAAAPSVATITAGRHAPRRRRIAAPFSSRATRAPSLTVRQGAVGELIGDRLHPPAGGAAWPSESIRITKSAPARRRGRRREDAAEEQPEEPVDQSFGDPGPRRAPRGALVSAATAAARSVPLRARERSQGERHVVAHATDRARDRADGVERAAERSTTRWKRPPARTAPGYSSARSSASRSGGAALRGRP